MKYPAPTKLIKTEIYRDGGSLSIIYAKDDLGIDEFELLLIVGSRMNLQEMIYDFESAHLNHGFKCIYKCKMTGQEIPDYKNISDNISWHQAKEIFTIIETLNRELSDVDRKRISIIKTFMNQKCAQQGDAPEPATNAIPSSPPFIPPAR